jgi:hypothetical protein
MLTWGLIFWMRGVIDSSESICLNFEFDNHYTYKNTEKKTWAPKSVMETGIKFSRSYLLKSQQFFVCHGNPSLILTWYKQGVNTAISLLELGKHKIVRRNQVRTRRHYVGRLCERMRTTTFSIKQHFPRAHSYRQMLLVRTSKSVGTNSTYFSGMYYKSRYCDVRVHTKLELESGLSK